MPEANSSEAAPPSSARQQGLGRLEGRVVGAPVDAARAVAAVRVAQEGGRGLDAGHEGAGARIDAPQRLRGQRARFPFRRHAVPPNAGVTVPALAGAGGDAMVAPSVQGAGSTDMIFSKLMGQFVDVIQWTDDSPDTMVWRFERQGNEIKYGAKLTVREGQTAVFVNEGEIADTFTPGMYELYTRNLPILSHAAGLAARLREPVQGRGLFLQHAASSPT